MMDQTGNETSQAKTLLKKVQMLQANMTLEQLDAMNLAKDDAAFREKEVERCQLNILHLERTLANATRAVKLQKELTAISTQSMQASLHRAYQANKNAVNAPHIEVETIEQQLSRAQSATKRAHVFYAQLQVRAQLMRGAEKMRKHFAEAVANAKAECGSFQKNLKAKEVNMEKPDDTVEIPGPVALTKDPKKIPEWFTKFLRKSGWKAPDAGEVESSEKDVSPSLKTADSSKEIQAGEVTVHPPTAPGGNHKVVVKLPSQNGKTRIAHNAEVHLDLAVQKAKKAKKADMGAGKKAETSSSTGAFDAEMKREKVEDGDDDDGMETGAPGSAIGATGNSELDNSKTGAATGSSENENKVTASAEKETKSAAVSKVENELKRANEELLSLETNLKIPVDGTTARAANAAAKVADDKTMRRA